MDGLRNTSEGSADAEALGQQAALARTRRDEILREIATVYIGADRTVEILLVALLARGHVLLEGVPGIAKTTLVKTFAETLGCDFKRIQFTPDLLPADITGTSVVDLQTNKFSLRKGPLFANIVLGDEINRAPAKTQSALLEAMQESQVTIDGETALLPPPFMVLATQNPLEHEGVYMLPEAQLDRFMFKVNLGYPTQDEERLLLRTYSKPVPSVRPLLQPAEIIAFSEAAQKVFVSEELMDYIVRLVTHTRQHPKVMLGASPRASLALMNASRVRALLDGRDFVLPDDLRFLVPYILGHRVILTPEAELDGTASHDVVSEALNDVPYAGPQAASR
ncbi:MAG: MoxR-like ATPase [Myxococcota bacterium]